MQLNSSVATRSAARGLILGAIWVGAVSTLANLSGCGQKGPLTLPGASAARSAPAASAAGPGPASAPAR